MWTLRGPLSLKLGAYMLKITSTLFIDESEIEVNFIRSSGPGGQNVNKVATAAQLRFNVLQSTCLPDAVRTRLITLVGRKLNKNGELIIKATRYRTQERNRLDALARFQNLLKKAAAIPTKRKKTKPAFYVLKQRVDQKKRQAKKKFLRQKKLNNDFAT